MVINTSLNNYTTSAQIWRSNIPQTQDESSPSHGSNLYWWWSGPGFSGTDQRRSWADKWADKWADYQTWQADKLTVLSRTGKGEPDRHGLNATR